MEIREALTFDDVLLVPAHEFGLAIDCGYPHAGYQIHQLEHSAAIIGYGYGHGSAHGDCHGTIGRYGGHPPQSRS